MAVTYKSPDGKYPIPRSSIEVFSKIIEALDLEKSTYEELVNNAQGAIAEFYEWPDIENGGVYVYPDGHVEIEPKVNNIVNGGHSVSPGGILIYNKLHLDKPNHDSYQTLCKTRKYVITMMTSLQLGQAEWDELNDKAKEMSSFYELCQSFNDFISHILLMDSELKSEVYLSVVGIRNSSGLLIMTKDLIRSAYSIDANFWSELYSSVMPSTTQNTEYVLNSAEKRVNRAVKYLLLVLKYEDELHFPVIRRAIALAVKAIYGPTLYQGRLRERIENRSEGYKDAMAVADELKLKVERILHEYGESLL